MIPIDPSKNVESGQSETLGQPTGSAEEIDYSRFQPCAQAHFLVQYFF
jgi:hypothetical protein